MEKVSTVKVTFISIVSMIGSFIANLFGGWTSDLETLMILMAIDFVMGLLIAAVWKRSGKSQNGALSSWSAWKGLCKKCVSLLFVLIAFRLDMAIGVDYIRTAVIIGFIVNELISIVENAGVMGVPTPSAITKAVDILRKKEGGTDGN